MNGRFFPIFDRSPREDAPNVDADAEFTAHAREDVPWLLEEVDRLRVRVEAAEAERDSMRKAVGKLTDHIRAQAEREAARIGPPFRPVVSSSGLSETREA